MPERNHEDAPADFSARAHGEEAMYDEKGLKRPLLFRLNV
jgi:hypothetical protein